LISNIPSPDYDIITFNGLRKYFDSIVYSYKTGLLKPDQKIFELSLRQLKADPKMTLMIGDSFESDIKGAKNAGIDGILISKDKIDFSDFRPYAVVPRLIDVLEAVENYFGQNKQK
jgi:FMN phosphatase YigB (HAD superfamily)